MKGRKYWKGGWPVQRMSGVQCFAQKAHTRVCVCVLIVGPDPIYGESLPHSPGPAVTSLGVCGGNGTLVQKLVTRSQRPPGPAHTDTTSVQYRLHYRSGIK